MPLTSAQKTALLTDIGNNPNNITYTDETGPHTVQIKLAPNLGLANNAIADWYNLFPGTSFFGNHSKVPLATIKGAIAWKRLTPTDAVPASPQLAVTLWTAFSMACQGCQFNLQMLMTSTGPTNVAPVIDATQAKVVAGLQDALQLVPSAAGGATQDAGWASVQPLLCRLGTNAEKLFASTANGNGSTNLLAATFVFEGQLAGSDVADARGG